VSHGAETITRVGGEKSTPVVLSPSLSAVLIDPNTGTARVRLNSGVAVTAEIEDDEIGPWSQAGPLTTVSLGERRAFVRVGREHVGLMVNWLP
jgi:hypothetical protein